MLSPTENDLKDSLGSTSTMQKQLKVYLLSIFMNSSEVLNFPGIMYGQSYLIRSKKRNIDYFVLNDGFFNIAFVLGQKEFERLMVSDVSETVKKEPGEAKVYTEGRGVLKLILKTAKF